MDEKIDMSSKLSMSLLMIIVGFLFMAESYMVSAQIPKIPCALVFDGEKAIIDLTCPQHTVVIKKLLDYGYMVTLTTATEMYLQPTTDTVEILKEQGLDLNFTFNLD